MVISAFKFVFPQFIFSIHTKLNDYCRCNVNYFKSTSSKEIPDFGFLSTRFLVCFDFLLGFGVGVGFLMTFFMHHPPNKRKYSNDIRPKRFDLCPLV